MCPHRLPDRIEEPIAAKLQRSRTVKRSYPIGLLIKKDFVRAPFAL
jgi:hypothetical protein